MSEKKLETLVPVQSLSQAVIDTLPKVAGVIPLAAWFIVVTEFCERFAFYGGSVPFQNYVEHPPQNATQLAWVAMGNATLQPGALGMGQATSTALQQFFTFFAYFTPLFGAFVSDQYWGKFKTIVVFSVIYMSGWILLTVSAYPFTLAPDGTPEFGMFAFVGYIVSIIIIGLGTGGIKSVVSPMCADQVPKESYVKTLKNGRQVVVDPEHTIQHLYNWFYWAINTGALLGQVVCVTLERDAFWKAFLLPACMFFLAILIFISGRKRYVVVPPQGSILKDAASCIRYSLSRKYKYKNQVQSTSSTFKFLDYAQPIDGETEDEAAKRVWAPTFPNELRQTLKACSVFPLMAIYWVCYNQMANNLVTQASQMTRPSWASNDILNVFNPVSLIVLIPLFDAGIFPLLRKYKLRFPYIARIAVGFVLGGLALVWASYVQSLIYSAGPYYDHPLMRPLGGGKFEKDTATPNDVSVWWQVPSYVLIAISESTPSLSMNSSRMKETHIKRIVFASIGALEYSYTHAPESMKCLVSALALVPNAGAALLGMAIAPTGHDPNMVWFYAFVGGTSVVVGGIFYILFRRFDLEDAALKAVGSESAPKASVEMAERDERGGFVQ